MSAARLLPALLALALVGFQDGGKKKVVPIEDNQFKLSGPVLFDAGSDVLKSESDDVLAEVRDTLEAKTYVTTLRIEGHSDTAGDASQMLTEKRALAVARWLVSKGIDCKRVIPVGFGSTKPVADNSTPEGKAQNRRMAFVVAGLRGRLIGGQPADGGGKVAGDPCAK